MEIQLLLDEAAACKSNQDGQRLLESMKAAFGKTPALRWLATVPGTVEMLEGPSVTAIARLAYCLSLSDYYQVSISLEVSPHGLWATVFVQKKCSGPSLSAPESATEGLSEQLTGYPNVRVSQFATRARGVATRLHIDLLERAGVESGMALSIAEANW